MKHGFLPVSREDMKKQNIDQLDFVYVIGDAYVDHPSFGPAIISRLLEARGYTVRRLASAVGISHEAMYQKINNERGFKASEIMNIAEVLGLSRSERDSIFFCR